MARCVTDAHLPMRPGSCWDGRISGIGTFSGRAPLAPGGLPGFIGPFPSTSLDESNLIHLIVHVLADSQNQPHLYCTLHIVRHKWDRCQCKNCIEFHKHAQIYIKQ